MDCKFVVGQNVACIQNGDDEIPSGWTILTKSVITPRKGTVYTVREVSLGLLFKVPVLRLVEIPDQTIMVESPFGQQMLADVVWQASAFRPLDKLKVDDLMKEKVPDLEDERQLEKV